MDRDVLAPYLRPMYLPAIEGIKDAQTQGRWEQVQAEDKRKWDANRPFVDAQAKQMQFAANKADDVNKIWNNLQGGQGFDPGLASAGVKPEEFYRAYLGLHAANPKIKVNLPGVGEAEVDTNKYMELLARQKQEEPKYPVKFNGQTVMIPESKLHNFKDTPKEPPTAQLVYRRGEDGKVYGEYVTPRPGMRINDPVPGGRDPAGSAYGTDKQVDDVIKMYNQEFAMLGDPSKWIYKTPEEQAEIKKVHAQLLANRASDVAKVYRGETPFVFGGNTPEQEKDNAFLEKLRIELNGGKPPTQKPQPGGRQFQVAPGINTQRPAINNPDGSISTEKTITIEIDGKHYLIPTIVDGKQLTPDQAVMATMAGKNNPVGEFNSAVEAEVAARLRSSQIGNTRPSGR